MKMDLISKKYATIVAVFLLSACVTQHHLDFDKQQAAKARVELALGYLQQNDLVQAKLNLDRALVHAPNYYLVHSALAHFYRLQGDNENARREFNQALKMDASHGDGHNNYGAFLCAQGEYEKAFEQFNQALISANYYHQTDTLENMTLCAQAAGQQERYQESFNKLQKMDVARAQKLTQAK